MGLKAPGGSTVDDPVLEAARLGFEDRDGPGAGPNLAQVLTHRPQRGAPEELIELGQVHDHAELVRLLD